MAMQKKVVIAALAVAAIMMVASVLALLQSSRTIPSSGTIAGVNLGVYQDALCTTPMTSIDWGTLQNGSSTDRIAYVKNDGKAMNMTLNMTASGWSPSDATDYLTLTWDQENTTLTPGQSVTATLTLAVAPTFTNGTDFSVNIIIKGTEQT